MNIAFIGFGEAAGAFTQGWLQNGSKPENLRAYDRKTDDPGMRAEKYAEYAKLQVLGCGRLKEAVGAAQLVVSTVTADQALAVAAQAAPYLETGTLYFDFNSVSPETKRAAGKSIEAGGARYADIAVMAPVHPGKLNVPLLIAGPHAGEARDALRKLGFNARVVEGAIGAASSIKMIRSIMVKGLEALSAECFLSAYQAGVEVEVLASLEESYPGFEWPKRADYNLDRMIVHGLRRAAEMTECACTTEALGQTGAMASASAKWQARIGGLALVPPEGLEAKVQAILRAFPTAETEN
jgi:3-hydroxyisobutyrate dehydrogenase-like beta-hydroxyacid dehydrogenase